jgi:hypothetical protein
LSYVVASPDSGRCGTTLGGERWPGVVVTVMLDDGVSVRRKSEEKKEKGKRAG